MMHVFIDAGVDALVINAISKCWTRVVDPETLLAILLGWREIDPWQPHIHAFFGRCFPVFLPGRPLLRRAPAVLGDFLDRLRRQQG